MGSVRSGGAVWDQTGVQQGAGSNGCEAAKTGGTQAHVSTGSSSVHKTELVLLVNRRLVSCGLLKRAIQTTYQQTSAVQKWFAVLVTTPPAPPPPPPALRQHSLWAMPCRCTTCGQCAPSSLHRRRQSAAVARPLHLSEGHGWCARLAAASLWFAMNQKKRSCAFWLLHNPSGTHLRH